MRIAILSDIHANLEALCAVLEAYKTENIDVFYCLGDTVGYGPNPRECLELAMAFEVNLLGNHDQAVLFDPPDFNPSAERSVFWTRKEIDAPVKNRQAADRRDQGRVEKHHGAGNRKTREQGDAQESRRCPPSRPRCGARAAHEQESPSATAAEETQPQPRGLRIKLAGHAHRALSERKIASVMARPLLILTASMRAAVA